MTIGWTMKAGLEGRQRKWRREEFLGIGAGRRIGTPLHQGLNAFSWLAPGDTRGRVDQYNLAALVSGPEDWTFAWDS